VRVFVGAFVEASTNRLGTGKLAALHGASATVEYFESILQRKQEEIPTRCLRSVRLYTQQRCYLLQDGRWVMGRIGQYEDSTYEVLMPDKRARYVPEAEIFVRCAAPLADPLSTLIAHGQETAFFHLHRSGFVRSLLRQRAAARGMTGLLSSRICLYPHQVEVVRRVLEDPVQRYLLADEVGLGKTVEAGVVLRQFLLDEPDGTALVLVPSLLVDQWRDELEERFRVSGFGDRVHLLGTGALSALPEESRFGMVVVDEAHHLTALAYADSPAARAPFLALGRLARAAERLLLLSATPALNHEQGFLAMLHLLDPEVYRLDGIEAFRRRVAQRQEIGRLILPLKEGAHPLVLKRTLERLRGTFPDDEDLGRLIGELTTALAEPGLDPADRNVGIQAIRAHVGETYRVHRRMLRTRRGSVEAGSVAARRDADTFGQLVSEHDLDDRAGPLHDLTDEWRVAALTAGAVPPGGEEQVSPHRRRSELFTLLLECAGSWSGVLAAAVRARLEGPLAPRLPAGFPEEAGRTLRETPAFPGEEEVLRSLLGAAERATGADDRIALLESVLRPSVRPPRGRAEKVVVFTGFTLACDEIVRRLRARFGPSAVARYCGGMTGTEVEAETRRFRNEPNCCVLVCDRAGEEGRNLQFADWLVHFDLPLAPNRIEQRIGRLDRIGRGRAVRTRVLLGPEVESSPFEAWYRVLRDGFRIFDRSIASLQFYVDARMPALRDALFESGAEALSEELIQAICAEIEAEQVRLDEQSVLDETDVRQQAASGFFEQLREMDGEAVRLRGEMETWICGALQFVGRRDGSVPGAVGYQATRNTLMPHDFLLRRFLPFVGMRATFDRTVAVGTAGVDLLRLGHPFVDLFAEAIHADDRGQAFAVWRQQPGWAFGAGAEWTGFRFDYVVEADLSGAREVLREAGVPESGLRSLRRRADALSPPFLAMVFVDLHGNEVADPELRQVLVRPFHRVRDGGTDTNLTKHRLRVFDEFVAPDAWEGVCRGAREASERAIRERDAFVRRCGEQAARAEREFGARLRVLERRLERNEADRAATAGELALERALAEAVSRGISSPAMRLDAVGFLVVSGHGPFEEAM
jgi:ATP-dependent helicase HepA